MKTTIKALTLALCAVLLVVRTVFATLAYLTSKTEVVTNTFTVGNVTITLDEAKVTEYGEAIGEERTTEGNEYRLIPGHTYTKDPTITVSANSEDCYVYAIVTIANFETLLEACGDDTLLPQNFVGGWDSTVWNSTSYTINENGSATCLFTYSAVVERNETEATELAPVFTTITLPGNVVYEADLSGVQIDVTGYAVQADGFATAADAWTATFGAPANG